MNKNFLNASTFDAAKTKKFNGASRWMVQLEPWPTIFLFHDAATG